MLYFEIEIFRIILEVDVHFDILFSSYESVLRLNAPSTSHKMFLYLYRLFFIMLRPHI